MEVKGMVSDNRDQLVGIAVQGVITSPELATLPASPYQIDSDGHPYLLPAPGGIVYNVRVGDRALGWLADMVQPGVSIRNLQDPANQALKTLSCVGNVARVTSGEGLGATGVVVGKSGRFAEHVIIYFSDEVVAKLALGDRIIVRAIGPSLAITDAPSVQLKSLSPELLDALGVEAAGPGRVRVSVAAVVPSFLTGAGAGLGSESGCVQIQTEDAKALSEHGLLGLRLGDIVAISDYDCRWGNGYLRGAMTVGVVVHGDSPRSGYGPGVTPLMAAADQSLSVDVVGSRNIVDLLHLGA